MGNLSINSYINGCSKASHKTIQVKGFDDLNNTDVDYFMIPGISDIDFEKLVKDAMATPNAFFNYYI